jgi:2-oxo-4-hydroxy-4-carboxy-5-ureidoimidazoline decarboxylase
MSPEAFNILPPEGKKAALLKCCGSSKWAEFLAEQFPFASRDEMKKESDRIWFGLGEEDWKKAFSIHPKIGDMESLNKKFASTAAWAGTEQSGVTRAGPGILQQLKDGNEAYEKKFGYIFIVCATGKSAEQMLSMLQGRLLNNPANEISIAAQEQNKITHLRLDKLFS